MLCVELDWWDETKYHFGGLQKLTHTQPKFIDLILVKYFYLSQITKSQPFTKFQPFTELQPFWCEMAELWKSMRKQNLSCWMKWQPSCICIHGNYMRKHKIHLLLIFWLNCWDLVKILNISLHHFQKLSHIQNLSFFDLWRL